MNRVFLVLVFLLAAFLVWRWKVPLVMPPIPQQDAVKKDELPEDRVEQLLGKPAGLDSFDRYSIVVEHPLFFKERRPPKPYVPEPPRKKNVSKTRKTRVPRIQLSAVVTVGNQTFALIKGGKQRVTRRVRVGDEVEEWTVRSILKDRIQLRNNGDRHEVLLRQYAPVALPRISPPKQAKQNKVVESRSPRRPARNGSPAKQQAKPVAEKPVD